jgi:ABC-type Zn2+ transport system substrate-binding protein/surface adhesin
MAIQPIDLQALFTQVDKVAKTQTAQREGLALQQEIQGTQLQRKTDAQIQSVNEAQNMGDGAEKINDQNKQRQDSSKEKKKETRHDHSGQEQRESFVFHDPRLGKNIDISL